MAVAVAEVGGDVDAARAVLIKRAVPDVMALFAASRVGGRYEHSEFPPTAGILQKRRQKGADEIWEGRRSGVQPTSTAPPAQATSPWT
ncbi:hypothetical protein [Streptomyces sp. PLM4]|uniref:hypothetical protein n=1 Tax=Streptomyces sp. PLM4 TaxID=2929798 RepID=UPI0020C0BA35|nr:hypothetical protein [Streptomyces sp. PLM4]